MLGIATGARLTLSQSGLPHDLDQLAALGCPALRWTFPWTKAQPTLGGPIDYDQADRVIAGCAERGMQLLMTTGTRGDGHLFDQATEIEKWCGLVGARYGSNPALIGFEGPNEMNLNKADSNQTPQRYVALQAAVYRGYKSTAPHVLVGNGGIVGSAKYLPGYYDAGLAAVIDMLGWHPYTHPLSPTESIQQQTRGFWAMHEARLTMAAQGDGHKQIWFTEYGTNTQGTNPSTEAVQASDLRDAVSRFRRHTWAGPGFVFCGIDATPMTSDPGDSMGLLRSDGTEKPAAGVYRELAAVA